VDDAIAKPPQRWAGIVAQGEHRARKALGSLSANDVRMYGEAGAKPRQGGEIMSSAKPKIRRAPEISSEDYRRMNEAQREAYRLSICHEMVDEGHLIDLGGGRFQRTAKMAPAKVKP
jgi:hypothetical protein